MQQANHSESSSARKAGPLQVAGAVFWSFFGIRKSKDYQADFDQITPAQIIVAGVVGGVLLVLGIALFVHFLVS